MNWVIDVGAVLWLETMVITFLVMIIVLLLDKPEGDQRASAGPPRESPIAMSRRPVVDHLEGEAVLGNGGLPVGAGSPEPASLAQLDEGERPVDPRPRALVPITGNHRDDTVAHVEGSDAADHSPCPVAQANRVARLTTATRSPA